MQRHFKKLLSLLQEELPERFKLQARETDKDYRDYYARIRDTKSIIHQKKPRNFEYKGVLKGVFIDILPIEPVPSFQLKKTIDNFLFRELHYKGAGSFYQKMKYSGRKVFLPIILFFIWLTRLYYKYIGRTDLYTYSYGVFFYATYNVKNFYPVSQIMFEGKSYKAPANVDKYLIENFDSNFMVIPKPDDRTQHGLRIEFFD